MSGYQWELGQWSSSVSKHDTRAPCFNVTGLPWVSGHQSEGSGGEALPRDVPERHERMPGQDLRDQLFLG